MLALIAVTGKECFPSSLPLGKTVHISSYGKETLGSLWRRTEGKVHTDHHKGYTGDCGTYMDNSPVSQKLE